MPGYKSGDRVRFTREASKEFIKPGVDDVPGTVADRRHFNDEAVAWIMINWDNGEWSTEKPEWLVIIAEGDEGFVSG